jgi:hypothetical protein
MKKLIINYTELVEYLLENRGMDGYIYFYESMETERGTVISFGIFDTGDSIYRMKFCPSDYDYDTSLEPGSYSQSEYGTSFEEEDVEGYIAELDERIAEKYKNFYDEDVDVAFID